MKLGLYSITYMGLWYRGEALTLPQLIARAKEFGYDGIEIDGKRPHGNPLDLNPSRCRDLRARADGEGIDVYAVAANNDFSNPVPEVREAQICYLRELIRMTADLGRPTLRVFLAWWGVTRHPQLATYDIAEGYWPIVHEKFSTEEIWGWCREALVECARYAGDAGVTLAPPESQAADQRPPRPLADGPRGRLAEPQALPRRPAHARSEHRGDLRTGAGRRTAPGLDPLRRRVRATGGRLDPGL